MGRVAGCLALGLFLGIRKRRDEEERLEEAQRALRDTLQQVRWPWTSLCLPAVEDRLLTKGGGGLMGPYAVCCAGTAQIRSPLSALRTFGKLLARRLQREEGLSLELARNILTQSDRLVELISPFTAGEKRERERHGGRSCLATRLMR